MVRISDLVKERRDVVISSPAGPINVSYRPNVRTPSDEAKMASKTGEDLFREMLIQMEQLIADWDLTGTVYDKETGEIVVEEDVVVPIKRECLQHISSTLLGQIFAAIVDDLRPKPMTSPKNSQNLFRGSFD